MLAFITLTLGVVAIIVGGWFLITKHQPHLMQTLIVSYEQTKNPIVDKITEFIASFKSKLSEADTIYQRFIQNHVDPLLGKKRQDYIKLLTQENKNELLISAEERFINHRVGAGVLALIAAMLGHLISPLFTGLAILFGFSVLYYDYYLAYFDWKQNHKLGTFHLISIYLAFLWLGGHVLIGALGLVLINGALKIKAIAERQSHDSLTNLFQIQPDTVWVRHPDGLEITIPFDQLKIDDVLVLYAGQTVPVDGIIISGIAQVDQHLLTGESQAIEKTINDPLLAATVILSGKIGVRVEKRGSETIAGQIMKILDTTVSYSATQSLRVLEITDRLVWPTLALSALSWPLLGTAGAASLLGANTIVTTSMTNPLALLNFLNLAAEHSILIKDGKGLDQLSQVDTIVFDKTGTLTLEHLQIVQIYALDALSEDELLTLAAAAEMRQSHPIAQAILAAAKTRQLNIPTLDQIHYEIGYGLKVWVPQGVVWVGSQRFMHKEDIPLSSRVAALTTQCHAEGHSLLMVALDKKLVGCIELKPTIRPEAQSIVAGLQKRDLNLVIISGDQEAPTRKLAHDLGMNGYFANTLPEQKANLVQQLQNEGHKICFIGDGINDALAMRQADVSISLRGATNAATDAAQIILMEGNLDQLPSLFQIAQDFDHNLTLNFRLTAATSLFVTGGIFFADFTFFATEIFYLGSLLGGLGIATIPLLKQRKAMNNQ